MTQDDLHRIEKTLGVHLPQHYVAMMTSREAEKARGDFWFLFLFNSAAAVVDHTIWLRDLMASYGLPFEQTFIVVSEVNGGDAVILDTVRKDDLLLVWDHETNLVSSFGCTLNAFAHPG